MLSKHVKRNTHKEPPPVFNVLSLVELVAYNHKHLLCQIVREMTIADQTSEPGPHTLVMLPDESVKLFFHLDRLRTTDTKELSEPF